MFPVIKGTSLGYEKRKTRNKKNTMQSGQCTAVIPAPGRQRQKDQKFEASLDYISRSCVKEAGREGGRRRRGGGDYKKGKNWFPHLFHSHSLV
jgi:hypothetical protein